MWGFRNDRLSDLSAPGRSGLRLHEQGPDIGVRALDGGFDPGHATFDLARAQSVLELGAEPPVKPAAANLMEAITRSPPRAA